MSPSLLLILAAVGMLSVILCGRSWPRLWLITTLTGVAAALVAAVTARAMEAWNPAWAGAEVPVSLPTLGLFHVALAIIILLSALWLWRCVRRTGPVRMLTWDCGYVRPHARMQYTVGSFASTINEWFVWILRPERHRRLPEGPFPREAHDVEHTPETVLEKIVQPTASLVLCVSATARRLQHGRIQYYLLYLLIGIGALSLLVLMGGAQ